MQSGTVQIYDRPSRSRSPHGSRALLVALLVVLVAVLLDFAIALF